MSMVSSREMSSVVPFVSNFGYRIESQYLDGKRCHFRWKNRWKLKKSMVNWLLVQFEGLEGEIGGESLKTKCSVRHLLHFVLRHQDRNPSFSCSKISLNPKISIFSLKTSDTNYSKKMYAMGIKWSNFGGSRLMA